MKNYPACKKLSLLMWVYTVSLPYQGKVKDNTSKYLVQYFIPFLVHVYLTLTFLIHFHAELGGDVFVFEKSVDPDQLTSKIRIHMVFYPICESIVINGILHQACLEIKKQCTVKPVLSGHSKIDKTMILKTIGSLMKAESIAECSTWSILQYF